MEKIEQKKEQLPMPLAANLASTTISKAVDSKTGKCPPHPTADDQDSRNMTTYTQDY